MAIYVHGLPTQHQLRKLSDILQMVLYSMFLIYCMHLLQPINKEISGYL